MAMIKIVIHENTLKPGGRFHGIPRNKIFFVIKQGSRSNMTLGGNNETIKGKKYKRGLSSFTMWADVNGQIISGEQLESLASGYSDPSTYMAPLINAMEKEIVKVYQDDSGTVTELSIDDVRNYTNP